MMGSGIQDDYDDYFLSLSDLSTMMHDVGFTKMMMNGDDDEW